MSPPATDYGLMLKAYRQAEGEPAVFADSDIAHLVVHQNRVLGSHALPGLEIDAGETENGIDLSLRVLPGVTIEHPVHLCFGVLPREGRQVININGDVGAAARVDLLAHCLFPNAVRVRHEMQARINVGPKAHYGYREIHFHGMAGGVQVIPRARITLGKDAILETYFQLVHGRVGSLDIDYEVEAAAGAVSEMVARVFASGNDRVRIREKCILAGVGSRGLVLSRVAVSDDAESEVISEMFARGRRSRGHVDCIEIVQDRGKAHAVPIVGVFEQTAKVTHEAAIGSVDKKQLETLMARGLPQKEAEKIIIKGMLGGAHA